MKLQFWSMDVIFAMVIFSVAIVILTFVWFSISQQFSITYSATLSNMQTDAQQLGNRLITPGNPAYWYYDVNPANLSTWANVSIGLANGNGTSLSEAKIAKLAAVSQINYQASKQLLGISYNYYIDIYSPQVYNYTIGLNPSLYNATTIIVYRVPVEIDNGVPASMRIIIWNTNQEVSASTTTVFTTPSTTI